MGFMLRNGKCINCKNDIVAYCEDYSFEQAITLTTYKEYRHISVEKCPNCDIVRKDLVNEKLNCSEEVLDTVNYNYALNCGFIDDKTANNSCSDLSIETNVGELDAYAVLCLNEDKFEDEIRSIFAGTDEKLKLARLYINERNNNSWFEYDEFKDVYTNIIKQIYDNVILSLNSILELCKTIDNKSVYLRLLKVETYIRLGLKEDAKKYFQKILDNYEISVDLRDFMLAEMESDFLKGIKDYVE